MKSKIYFKTILFVLAFLVTGVLQAKSTRVLMVVSGYGVDEGETQPGFEFDEFAKAYLVFNNNGLEVDVASPQGGAVVADKYNPQKSYNQQIVNDAVVMKKLANTLSTKSVLAEEYGAVFVVGGKGAMFDLPKDKHLQKLIADIYENQGSVSAVCHGPAALTDVKLSNGDYLVAGKKVNGFTNVEERAFGKKWLPKFEFMLEDRLKERGAIFEKSAMMLNHVARDGRLITGQNPFSTTATATEVVRSLGIKPVNRTAFKDEATIDLVAKILDGEKLAETELLNNSDNYQPNLVAMYGYYRMMHAQDDSEIRQAIGLMELSVPFMDNPQLNLAIARGYQKLGNNSKAKMTLDALLKKHPKMAAAEKMLAALSNQ